MKTKSTEEVSQSFNTFFLRLLLLRELRIEAVADDIEGLDEVFILELIHQYDGIIPSRIVKILGKHFGTVLDILSKLSEKGFVEQERAGAKRKIPLHLTALGKAELDRLRQRSSLHILDLMIEGMKEEDVQKLKDLLSVLLERQKAQF